MSIDLSQFKQTFLEESEEGLDVLESGLLALDNGSADDDVIHSVFRAAHSIKGGAGTFGLNEIASFTHVMETLLDEMRDGRREIGKVEISALLGSVDILRDMLSAASDDVEPDMERANETIKLLEDVLNNNTEGNSTADADNSTATAQETPDAQGSGWKVSFKPMEHMLRTGNDTVRIIRELRALSECKITLDDSALPSLGNMDPDHSYLAWNAELYGDVEQSEINEIFEWVDEDCELKLTPLQATAETVTNEVVTEVDAPAITAEVKPQEIAQKAEASKAAAASSKKTTPAIEKKKSDVSSIRVGTDKVDELINMVGELVITQSMLSQMGSSYIGEAAVESMREGLAQLERNTRELQESVMRIRMLPISFSFQRFPRMVHDLSQKLGKKIELKLSGEQTELDKTVMEKIGDPLVHLVRNSLDHGIESPEQRVAAGKPETGMIHLNAYHQGGHIMIEIIDDGAGLPKDKLLNKAIKLGIVSEDDDLSDEKIYELIFHPGFSTADQISDVSGRGVGMDVVRKNIKELGGNIELDSKPGKGTKFTIRLPLTLAILDGQLVCINDEIYIIPLVSIIESIEIDETKISSIAGGNEVYQLRDDYVQMLYLDKVFKHQHPRTRRLQDSIMVVVESDNSHVGIVVDDLLTQQQVVIKSLESNYMRVEGISGATILGDGTVALILDLMGLISMTKQNGIPNTLQCAS